MEVEPTAALVEPVPREATDTRRYLLSKVPEVVLAFWVIKILCTTVGETAADFLSIQLGLGLVTTAAIMSTILIAVLVLQFREGRYVPAIYWSVVVLVSIVGTQITDYFVDELGIALSTTTIAFALILGAVFATWQSAEGTLSIHSIVTRRREAFYWLAVLFTFALGTAAGDFLAEQVGLGYLGSLAMFAGAIGLIAIAHFVFRLDAVLAFWLAYILTRPLGASIGDWLSQVPDDGGLGLGTVVTSAIFLGAILLTIVYLTATREDVIAQPTD